MKKRVVFFIILLFLLIFEISAEEYYEPAQDPLANYRLFKTTNIWNFLQLETTTGRIWLIQFSVDTENRGGVSVNDINLAQGKKIIPGRFTLYPTSNMWTFILLDQIDGSSWQVQWSFDENKRFIIPLMN